MATTIYGVSGSRAIRSLWAIEETGTEYTHVPTHFFKDSRTADYLAINPKGRVPTLVTGQGVLTETPALLLYVAQSHPAANLAPLDNPFALAEAQAFNNYLCATVHVAHAHRRRGQRYADDPGAWKAMAACGMVGVWIATMSPWVAKKAGSSGPTTSLSATAQ